MTETNATNATRAAPPPTTYPPKINNSISDDTGRKHKVWNKMQQRSF